MKVSPSTEGPHNLLIRVNELPLIASIKASDNFDNDSNEDINDKFRMLSDRSWRQGSNFAVMALQITEVKFFNFKVR